MTKELDTKFTQSFQGLDWAKGFIKMVSEKPSIATDLDTMHTWFSNAIMRGYDEADRKSDKRLESMIEGYIQYKGTDICIDLECKCGWEGHFDGHFCYGFECPICKRTYLLHAQIPFIPAEKTKENEWMFITPPKEE